MKKIAAISLLGMLFLSFVLPLGRADDDGTDNVTGTGMTGTPQEMAALQKTLANEQIDTLQKNISDLTETVNALTERVADLERTVFDDDSRQ